MCNKVGAGHMRGVGNAPYILMILWTSPYILKDFCLMCTYSYLDPVGWVGVFFYRVECPYRVCVKKKMMEGCQILQFRSRIVAT